MRLRTSFLSGTMGRLALDLFDVMLITNSAYEGLLTKEIREKRESQGLDQERDWNIWIDGCEDGE